MVRIRSSTTKNREIRPQNRVMTNNKVQNGRIVVTVPFCGYYAYIYQWETEINTALNLLNPLTCVLRTGILCQKFSKWHFIQNSLSYKLVPNTIAVKNYRST
jgi:hypothetical protein